MTQVLGTTAASAALVAVVLLWTDGLVEFTGYQLVLLMLAAIAIPRLRSERVEEDETPSLRLRRSRQPERLTPRQLEKIERLVMFSRSTAFDAEWRLIPFLRTLADERLVARHGFGLADQPEMARRVLGDEAWELLTPSREQPFDRMAAGLTLESLEVAVSSIEGI